MSPKLRVLALLLLGLTAFPADAKEWKVVRIGTGGTYPPFNVLDQDGRFRGFEIDVANALCARMKVRCEFMQQDWDDMIPALLANRFDAILASMSITEERKKQIDFSNRYYRTPASFVARKAINLRDTSPLAMDGRVIGVQSDTVHANYLKAVYEPAGAVLRLYASNQEAQLELARGRVDAILADKLGTYEWLTKTEQGECCETAGAEILDPAFIGEGVGVGLRQEDDDLRERFNLAIDSILADGTYKQINDRYFPFPVY